MGLARIIAKLGRHLRRNARPLESPVDSYRICRVEELEGRRLMAADLQFGSVYYDPHAGDGMAPQQFYISFDGGAAGTQLTHLTINLNKNGTANVVDPSSTSNDNFFHTASSAYMPTTGYPFAIVSSDGVTVTNVSVLNDSTELDLDFSGFTAGKTLVFSIKVDEAQNPNNVVVEGAELEGAVMTGTFTNPDYYPVTGSGTYRDAFNFTSAGLTGLPPDSYTPPSPDDEHVYTAGAETPLEQTPLPSSIAGISYVDNAGTGTYQVGDTLLANVPLALLDSSGNVVQTTTTGNDGSYKFSNLVPGTYSVHETEPSGYLPGSDFVGSLGGTNPDRVDLTEIPVGPNQNGVNYNFYVIPPNSISGVVKSEPALGHTSDPSDTPIPGVSVELLDHTGTVVATTTTDNQGQYSFTNLYPGSYSVRATQPSAYLPGEDKVGSQGGTTNGTLELDGASLLGGVNGINYNFYVIPPNSISGTVIVEPALNQTSNPADKPLSGVTVQLLNQAGTVLATTTTDSSGNYSFTRLMPGTYDVREIEPSGYIEAEDRVGSVGGNTNGATELDAIALSNGVNGVNYNFYLVPPNTISGQVKLEVFGDCETHPEDPPMAGVTIQLLNSQGTVIGTTVTDTNGDYQFTNLLPGSYSVRDIVPAGYLAGDSHVGSEGGTIIGPTEVDGASLIGGVDGTGYDFCIIPPNSISGIVKVDLDGNCETSTTDPPLAGVTIQLLDGSGNLLETTTTNAAGMYYFGNLMPDTYEVRELVPAGYFADDDHVGSQGGVLNGLTEIDSIALLGGVNGTDYNFCVVPPGSISGIVKVDLDGNCETSTTDPPLAGVTIQLHDDQGNLLGTTTTDVNGMYTFGNLMPGTYEVTDVVPGGYFADDDHVGTVGGVLNGPTEIDAITLPAGIAATDYNFCVVPPGSISGIVKVDLDGNCETSTTDPPLAGVTIQLRDDQGNLLGTTTTDASGQYTFGNLMPGTYEVNDVIPGGYFADDSHVGTVGGVLNGPTEIDAIALPAGVLATGYDFCVVPPASIEGIVKSDLDGNCETSTTDPPIAGVTIQLFDTSGNLLATTTTNSAGIYTFGNLMPGTYEVHDIDLPGYFLDDSHVGSVGGDNPTVDFVTNIVLPAGIDATDYNFCLVPQGTLSGYVFQDGPTIELASADQVVTPAEAGRTGVRVASDPPIAGVTLILADANGNVLTDAQGNPIETVTDSSGHYAFTGLAPNASYTVYEIEPSGYIKGIDTAGSTGGTALNPGIAAPANYVGSSQFVIIGVPIAPGANSIENNFSELVEMFTPPPPIVPPVAPAAVPLALAPYVLPPSTSPIQQLPIAPYTPPITSYPNGGDDGFTWHLSVINAGQPRGDQQGEVQVTLAAQQNVADTWESPVLQMSLWKLAASEGENAQEAREFSFGMKDGIPITGDFNGDGVTDIGVFYRGQWFIDLNGNGIWDKDDLWAKLGYSDDLPVVGDWDGDGKADIGIYGQAWPGDPRAVAQEPGLPDPDNRNAGVRKNAPPRKDVAPHGWRSMQRTSTGKVRADLIDHVFFYGVPGDHPIAGDWNGAGVDTIGVFRDGRWDLDVDGNGKWSDGDITVQMGQKGDLPVIGDFNGDGTDEIGIYRNGMWHIDTNGDRILDDKDQIVQHGAEGDKPVVGDWNGDGRDEMGVYRKGAGKPSIKQP